MIGCSNKEDTQQQINTLIQQNEELKKLLEERPNITSHELRETLNLSFKVIQAMKNSDSTYLESIVNSNVTVDDEKQIFIFEDGYEQSFSNFDYSLLEYRAQFSQDNRITVALAEVSPQSNIEIYFEFIQVGETYLLPILYKYWLIEVLSPK